MTEAGPWDRSKAEPHIENGWGRFPAMSTEEKKALAAQLETVIAELNSLQVDLDKETDAAISLGVGLTETKNTPIIRGQMGELLKKAQGLMGLDVDKPANIYPEMYLHHLRTSIESDL